MTQKALALAVKPFRFSQLFKATRRLVSAALLCGMGAASLSVAAFQQSGPAQTATVASADLPRQGQQMYRLILQGGPFPHKKDGVVFGNYERQLPLARRGYYHEYTVDTPGARDRGARRIVCGGYRRTAPDACYYTSDHYRSFKKIKG
jgi:ribonuclease T1